MEETQKNKLLVDNIEDLAAFSQWVKQTKPLFNLKSSNLQGLQSMINEFKGRPQLLRSLDDFVDVDDFEKYKQTTRQDVPRPEKDEIRKTLSVDQQKSMLNSCTVECQITDHVTVKGGFFGMGLTKEPTVYYTVATEVDGALLKWIVKRTDEDFLTLRKLLGTQFPYMLIPPLPPAVQGLKDKSQVPKKIKMYHRFLEMTAECEVLKSAACLVDFLRLPEQKDWEKAARNYAQSGFKIVTEDGQMDCRNRDESFQFCANVKSWHQQYVTACKLAAEISHEVYTKSVDLALKVSALSKQFAQISELNLQAGIQSQASLFGSLSQISIS